MVKKLDKVQKNFPDYEGDSLPDRAYFFQVVNTLMGDWLLE
jgi:hypothetical protein